MAAGVKQGAAIAFGIEHAAYMMAADPVAESVRASLATDLL
jgi:hypothetical protein